MKRAFRRKPVFALLAIVVSSVVALTAGTMPASANPWKSDHGSFAYSSKRIVVGMGDSFTSGTGAPPFVDNTVSTCKRSVVAYPLVVGFVTPRTKGKNVACSGARTADLFTTFRGEPAQVSRLGNATDIVLTVGGNDIDALGAISSLPTPEEFAAKLQALAPQLVSTYKRLQAAAPSAKIHVLGYPYLFPTGDVGECSVDQATRTYLLQAQAGLNQTIQGAATAAGVSYIDDSQAFAGHEICTDRPWVNDVDTANPDFSFHPNQAGHIALGLHVARSLR